MQQQSKTEQLINRTNYRKHRQKLDQIKRNDLNTSLHYYSAAKARPLDRKKLLMLKMKRQEIEQENQHLRKKIEKIANNTSYDNWKNNKRNSYSESQTRRASHSTAHNIRERKHDRYAQQPNQDQNVIGVFSQCNNGQSLKCFVPTAKNKLKYRSIGMNKISDYNAIIFNLRQKQSIEAEKRNTKLQKGIQTQKQNGQNINENTIAQNPQRIQIKNNQNQDKQYNPSITILDQNSKLKQLIKQSAAIYQNPNKNDTLYNQPQKQAHRIVLFKKTKIFYPMTSFLIQISLIQNQILITAYGMGTNSQDYRLLISKKRSKQIMYQGNGNYQLLWNRIQVDVDGIKLDGSSYETTPFLQNVIPQVQENQKNSQQRKYEIAQDFLQRNYYNYTAGRQSITTKGKDKQLNLFQGGNQKVQPQNQKQPKQQKNKPKSIFRNKIEYRPQFQQFNPNINNQKPKQQTVHNLEKQTGKIENIVQKKLFINGVKRVTDKTKEQPVQLVQAIQKSKNIENKNKQKQKLAQNKLKQEIIKIKEVESRKKAQNKSTNTVKSKQSEKSKSDAKINLETKKETKLGVKEKREVPVEDYGDQFQEERRPSKIQDKQQLDYQQQYQQIQEEVDSKNKSTVKNPNNQIQKYANSLVFKSAIKNSSKVDEYEQSFEQQKAEVDEQYEMQFENNPSRLSKENESTKAVKKKQINNKSKVVSAIQDQIEQEVSQSNNHNNKLNKKDKKYNKKDEVQQYLNEQFEA